VSFNVRNVNGLARMYDVPYTHCTNEFQC